MITVGAFFEEFWCRVIIRAKFILPKLDKNQLTRVVDIVHLKQKRQGHRDLQNDHSALER